MGILLWIIFGALAGWITSMIVRSDTHQGLLGDLVLGVLGAIAGGFIMNMLGQPGITGFNAYSLVVAIVGSVILVSVKRMIT